MGQINTEQAVEIIEAVTETVAAATPEVVVTPTPETNYIAWAIVGLVPMIVGGVWAWLKKRKKP